MVVGRRASREAVVEVDETGAQPVSPCTTTRSLSAPNLCNLHYHRVRAAEWRGGERVRERSIAKRRKNDAA